MTEAAHGSEPFDRIARRHAPWLLRFLERRAPAGLDAEDLLQDVLVAAYRKRSHLGGTGEVRPYLVGIAKRVLAAAVRKRARRNRLLRLAPFAGRRERSAPRLDALARAVRELPEELAEVIDVYYSREVTYETAAEILGVSRATVQSRLRRALRELRRILGVEEEERP